MNVINGICTMEYDTRNNGRFQLNVETKRIFYPKQHRWSIKISLKRRNLQFFYYDNH